MNNILKQAYKSELKIGTEYFHENMLSEAFSHFERAHILGQRFIIAHTYSHIWMLKVGLRRRDLKEVSGQLVRIIASILFSKLWVPVGNTGGVNVNPLKVMDIPSDLKEFLRKGD